MPGPHKGVSTQHTTQQQYAKPRHQPSNRDQQARDRLRNKVSESKAKIAENTYNWAQRHYRLYIRFLTPIYLLYFIYRL